MSNGSEFSKKLTLSIDSKKNVNWPNNNRIRDIMRSYVNTTFKLLDSKINRVEKDTQNTLKFLAESDNKLLLSMKQNDVNLAESISKIVGQLKRLAVSEGILQEYVVELAKSIDNQSKTINSSIANNIPELSTLASEFAELIPHKIEDKSLPITGDNQSSFSRIQDIRKQLKAIQLSSSDNPQYSNMSLLNNNLELDELAESSKSTFETIGTYIKQAYLGTSSTSVVQFKDNVKKNLSLVSLANQGATLDTKRQWLGVLGNDGAIPRAAMDAFGNGGILPTSLEETKTTYSTVSSNIEALSDTMFGQIGSGIDNTITKLFKGEINDLDDVWGSTLESMLNDFLSWASKLSSGFIKDKFKDMGGGILDSLFGGGTSGSGAGGMDLGSGLLDKGFKSLWDGLGGGGEGLVSSAIEGLGSVFGPEAAGSLAYNLGVSSAISPTGTVAAALDIGAINSAAVAPVALGAIAPTSGAAAVADIAAINMAASAGGTAASGALAGGGGSFLGMTGALAGTGIMAAALAPIILGPLLSDLIGNDPLTPEEAREGLNQKISVFGADSPEYGLGAMAGGHREEWEEPDHRASRIRAYASIGLGLKEDEDINALVLGMDGLNERLGDYQEKLEKASAAGHDQLAASLQSQIESTGEQIALLGHLNQTYGINVDGVGQAGAAMFGASEAAKSLNESLGWTQMRSQDIDGALFNVQDTTKTMIEILGAAGVETGSLQERFAELNGELLDGMGYPVDFAASMEGDFTLALEKAAEAGRLTVEEMQVLKEVFDSFLMGGEVDLEGMSGLTDDLSLTSLFGLNDEGGSLSEGLLEDLSLLEGELQALSQAFAEGSISAEEFGTQFNTGLNEGLNMLLEQGAITREEMGALQGVFQSAAFSVDQFGNVAIEGANRLISLDEAVALATGTADALSGPLNSAAGAISVVAGAVQDAAGAAETAQSALEDMAGNMGELGQDEAKAAIGDITGALNTIPKEIQIAVRVQPPQMPQGSGGATWMHTGGQIMHQGGYLHDSPVAWHRSLSRRLHSGDLVRGLASDEVPIIAQQGEFMVRRSSVNATTLPALHTLNQTGRLAGRGGDRIQINNLVNIEGNLMGSDEAFEDLVRKIEVKLNEVTSSRFAA